MVIGMFVTGAVSIKQALPGDMQPLPLRFELDAVLPCNWERFPLTKAAM